MRKGSKRCYSSSYVPPSRCSVRAETSPGHEAEVGITINERQAYSWCDRYADKTHLKVRIVNVDTGETIYTRKAERVAAAMGGAA